MIVGEKIIGVVISAIVVFSGVAAPLAVVGPGFRTAGIIIGGLAFAVSVRALSLDLADGSAAKEIHAVVTFSVTFIPIGVLTFNDLTGLRGSLKC